MGIREAASRENRTSIERSLIYDGSTMARRISYITLQDLRIEVGDKYNIIGYHDGYIVTLQSALSRYNQGWHRRIYF
jgi:hypothetical protein